MTGHHDAASLRAAGRELPLPATLRLADGRTLELERVLRLLPGKRIAARARLEGRPVMAKLFIARRGARRHWRRELHGLHALHDRGLPTPRLMASGAVGGILFVITEWLDKARSLAEEASGVETAEREHWQSLFLPLARLLGRMHAAGLWQEDVHIGNFLLQGAQLHVIDGDALKSRGNRPLAPARACDNLGRLLAELLLPEAPEAELMLQAYRDVAGAPLFRAPELAAAHLRHHHRRMRMRLARVARDCSRYRVRVGGGRWTAVLRERASELEAVLSDPDGFMEEGEPLKKGGSSTVVLVHVNGQPLVIKRYNLKNLRVRLKRLPRRSRPLISWREGRRLEILGVDTPRPLALVRERRLGLYGRAWLITEYVPGEDIRQRWRPREQGPDFPEADLQVLRQTLETMARGRVTHGDMKGSNILWYRDRPFLMDLDAVRGHRREASFRRAREEDMTRFLENWPEDAPLRQWLHNALFSGHSPATGSSGSSRGASKSE